MRVALCKNLLMDPEHLGTKILPAGTELRSEDEDRIKGVYHGLSLVCHFSTFFYSLDLYVFVIGRMARRILAPRQGTELESPALEAWSPSHWAARDFPFDLYLEDDLGSGFLMSFWEEKIF